MADGSGLGQAVRALRLRAGLSLNELARRTGVDPAYVHRIENAPAERPVVPRRPLVRALGSALALERVQLDDLLSRAGYVPETVVELGGWDSALADVAAVLSDPAVPAAAKAEFREVLRILANRWLDVSSPDSEP